MMDDFIRPPKKEVKQETKQRPIKEVLIVILIIVLQAMFQKRMLLLKIQMIAVLLMKFMIL